MTGPTRSRSAIEKSGANIEPTSRHDSIEIQSDNEVIIAGCVGDKSTLGLLSPVGPAVP